jgi:hemoglobin
MLPPVTEDTKTYGVADASFRAAGGEAGIRRWVEDFYRIMDSWPPARRIRAMHPDDLDVSIDKLALFLGGWLGGPKRFREKYGPIALPHAHRHLPIDAEDRDAWLACMERALAEQPFEDDFKAYLREQLAIPAERIRRVCAGESPRA